MTRILYSDQCSEIAAHVLRHYRFNDAELSEGGTPLNITVSGTEIRFVKYNWERNDISRTVYTERRSLVKVAYQATQTWQLQGLYYWLAKPGFIPMLPLVPTLIDYIDATYCGRNMYYKQAEVWAYLNHYKEWEQYFKDETTMCIETYADRAVKEGLV